MLSISLICRSGNINHRLMKSTLSLRNARFWCQKVLWLNLTPHMRLVCYHCLEMWLHDADFSVLYKIIQPCDKGMRCFHHRVARKIFFFFSVQILWVECIQSHNLDTVERKCKSKIEGRARFCLILVIVSAWFTNSVLNSLDFRTQIYSLLYLSQLWFSHDPYPMWFWVYISTDARCNRVKSSRE